MEQMSTMQKRRRFVELRARGVSYRKIAEEINVAKSTLVRWSRLFAVEVKNLEKMEREAFEDEYLISRQHRVKVYAMQLNSVAEELLSRDLRDVPTHRLFEIQSLLSKKLKSQSDEMPFGRRIVRAGPEDVKRVMNKVVTWEG